MLGAVKVSEHLFIYIYMIVLSNNYVNLKKVLSLIKYGCIVDLLNISIWHDNIMNTSYKNKCICSINENI